MDHMPGAQSYSQLPAGNELGQAANPAPPVLPAQLEDGGPGHVVGTKAASCQQFPFKLFAMMEDESVRSFVRWSKSECRDAIYIPNIKAFEANVMPKHFEAMKKWGSLQKQLNNYGFEKHDRRAGKALYAHSGNNFRPGRPDLLPDVVRKRSKRTKPYARRAASPAPEPPSTPNAPVADGTTPQSGSQTDSHTWDHPLRLENVWLKAQNMELRQELQTRQLVMENRLIGMENILREALKKSGGISGEEEPRGTVACSQLRLPSGDVAGTDGR